MAEFDVKTTNLTLAGQSENKIECELSQIETDIERILSNLQITSEASTEIKRRLRNSMGNVTTIRQKIRALSRSLDEIARIYQDTENGIVRNIEGAKNLRDMLNKASGRLLSTASAAGLSISSAFSKDPVNLCNGNYVYEKTFLELDTIIPMNFRVFYNVQSKDIGALGRGWIHSYEIKLVFTSDSIAMIQDDASLLIFFREEDDAYYPLHGTMGKLVKTESGYEVTDRDQYSYIFDRNGRWLQKKDSFGNEFEMIYEGTKLVMVKMSREIFYHFKYDVEGRLIDLFDSLGRRVRFQYEENQVCAIEAPGNRVLAYQYDQDGRLTVLKNGRNTTCLKNTYDLKGRTIQQEFPDGGVVTYEYLDDKNQVRMTEQNGNVIIYERDSLERNIRNIYENGEETFTYNANNQRTSFTDRNGNTSFYEYDEGGNLRCFTNPLQDKIQYTYTALNQVESVALNGVVLYRAVYNDKNQQEFVEDASGGRNTYEYNDAGQPIAWVQADGCRIELTYNEAGNMNSITNTMGGRTSYEYDDQHRVTRIIDPLGNETELIYNESDELAQIKNANGDIQTYKYDACGNLIKMVDFAGGITEIQYNSMNKPIRITNAEGQSIETKYDVMWNPIEQIMGDGGITKYEYDKQQRLVKVTSPTEAVNQLAYDHCGNLIQRIDPEGGVHKIAYDALNRPNRVTDPCGCVTAAEYDALGNVTKVLHLGNDAEVQENPSLTDVPYEEYRYDLLGNIIFSRDCDGYCKYYKYDSASNLICIEDEEKWLEKYTYYPGGLLKSEQKRDGAERSFAYDLNENLVKITNQDGCSWHFEYDNMERIVHCWQDEGISETYEYDALDNIIAVTDGEGNRTAYEYTACGNVKAVTDAKGHSTYFRYDACQHLMEIIQHEGDDRMSVSEIHQFNRTQKSLRITSYERDKAGKIIKVIDPEGNKTSYTYDGCGRILSQLDGDGNLTTCEYNPDGTAKEYHFADGRFVKYQYNALKHLVQMEDWLGITSITNDVCGRVQQVMYPNGEKVSYEWGKRGEQTGIVYPDGFRVKYLYDDALRLTQLEAGEDTVSYSYLKNGRLKERACSNGCRTIYRHDIAGKLRELCHIQGQNILEKITYQYDKNDRKSKIIRSRAGAGGSGVYEYQYDSLGSLISVHKDGMEEERYLYDNFGNRIFANIRSEEQKYTYNRLNQLICLHDSKGEHKYSYDSRGNMIQEALNGNEVLKLTFNALNRLEQLQAEGWCTKYSYNGFGHRTEKKVFSAERDEDVTLYLYDIIQDSSRLLQSRRNQQREDVFWDGGLLGVASDGKNRFFMNDERMSPLRMVEENSSISYQMDTFGNLLDNSVDKDLLFGYTGYLMDGDSQFYYANQREYSPNTGRFLSKDIIPGLIMVPLTLNAYGYCMGDPVNYTDPTGQIFAWLAGGIVGAAANVAGKLAGDVVKSVKSGKMEFSSWQSYVGTAAGGFTSGVVLATTGNMAAAGAAGSAVETFTTGGLSMLTGEKGYRKEDGYSFGKLVGQTASSAVGGAVTGFAFGAAAKYIKIPGINKGRGSCEAVWKQVMTKSGRGQIANVSWKTLGKGLLAYGPVKMLDQILVKGKRELEDTLTSGVKNWGKKQLEKLTQKTMPAANVNTINAGTYLSSYPFSAKCPSEGV